MKDELTIVGRGKVGRALCAAWGGDVPNVSHRARPKTGCVLLAVPDDHVADVARYFGGRAVHLSGSLSLPGVPCAHPLTSFDGEARDWRGTSLALTGAVPKPVVDRFVSIGFAPFELPAEHKALYHAAAVLTSGHAATLWLGAERLLAGEGIVLPGAGLWPLVEATVRNVQAHGEAGRTGPFARQDEATIDRDRAALPEAWRRVFVDLGRALDPKRGPPES